MDLKIKNQWFIVGGATSGFGRATAEKLIEEGAGVLGIARSEDALKSLQEKYPGNFKYLAGDLSKPDTLARLKDNFDLSLFSGALVNAGGPPAMQVMETKPADWDNAYNLLLRWKVEMTQLLIPHFLERNYGKLVFVESVSVKQPVDNLVLSNSIRMAVVGFVKTLSQEIAGNNICINIMAPGYHNTPAVERVFKKKSEIGGISIEQAKKELLSHVPSGRMGDPSDFASLAVWLLSPLSNYINGQTLTVDGGSVRGSYG